MVKISFGVVTDGANDSNLEKVVASIFELRLESFEVIIVGSTQIRNPMVRFVPFDEALRPGWITRKKNLLAHEAKGDVLLVLHDYVALTKQWTQEAVDSLVDAQWDVAMCRILNLDGSRFRDWALMPKFHRGLSLFVGSHQRWLLPYRAKGFTRYMYVSGSAMIVRRSFLIDHPLDEALGWGEGEDIRWSLDVRKNWRYKLFPNLCLQSTKQKDVVLKEIDLFSLAFLCAYGSIERRLPEVVRRSLERDVAK